MTSIQLSTSRVYNSATSLPDKGAAANDLRQRLTDVRLE